MQLYAHIEIRNLRSKVGDPKGTSKSIWKSICSYFEICFYLCAHEKICLDSIHKTINDQSNDEKKYENNFTTINCNLKDNIQEILFSFYEDYRIDGDGLKIVFIDKILEFLYLCIKHPPNLNFRNEKVIMYNLFCP